MATQVLTVSVEDYFRSEETSLEHEYLDGVVYAMAGGTVEHSTIGTNVIITLRTQLSTSGFIVRGPDTLIRTGPNGLYTYADVSVACGTSLVEENCLLNPVLLVELLSPPSANDERSIKFEMYRQIPTFSEYVVIAQDRVDVEHHVNYEARWTMTVCEQRADVIKLQSIPAALALQSVYVNVWSDSA